MREIILVHAAGKDQLGMTAAITQVMAQYQVNVLDLSQAMIHDALTLGVLLEIPSEVDSAAMLKQLVFSAAQWGVILSFKAISEESYQELVAQQQHSRYIITLLARCSTAEQIARVTQVLADHQLNIEQINRLSRVLDQQSKDQKACIEFIVRGEPDNLTQMRAEFLAAAQALGVDIAFQKDNAYRRHRRLVVFDMDSTLIESEVIDELAKAAGVGDQVAEVTERAMQGALDFKSSFRQRVALLKGLDQSVLAQIGESLPLTEGAEGLIKTLKALGYKTAIISGGFTYFGRILQQQLGIDYMFANELLLDAQGKVTGEVLEPIVDGERKAVLLQEIAQQEGLNLEQVIAVGDGANDLPMLGLAGLGIAFRAKPLVKQTAQHAISALGLDGILYLLGVRDSDQVDLIKDE